MEPCSCSGACSWGLLGLLFTARSRPSQTILLRALGIFVRCLGEKHQHIVDTLTSLAVLCTSEGNVSEADTYNQRAVAMYYDLRQEAASDDGSSSVDSGSGRSARSRSPGAGTGATHTAADSAGGSGGQSPRHHARSHGTHTPSSHRSHGHHHDHDATRAVDSGEEDDDEDDEVCEEFKTFDWTEVVTAMHAVDGRSV